MTNEEQKRIDELELKVKQLECYLASFNESVKDILNNQNIASKKQDELSQLLLAHWSIHKVKPN